MFCRSLQRAHWILKQYMKLLSSLLYCQNFLKLGHIISNLTSHFYQSCPTCTTLRPWRMWGRLLPTPPTVDTNVLKKCPLACSCSASGTKLQATRTVSSWLLLASSTRPSSPTDTDTNSCPFVVLLLIAQCTFILLLNPTNHTLNWVYSVPNRFCTYIRYCK